MRKILGLKFRDHGQIYYFDSGEFDAVTGDHVLVQTEQGVGLGVVAVTRDEPPPDAELGELKPIHRMASADDLVKRSENEDLARRARRFCRARIEGRALDMKLVDVEVFHDRSKVVFYFTAPGRVDFRDLVKDLVREFRTRIELRQIGVRHETQMVGALGNCGQVCCCRRFMRKFAPVTIKMAKEQNLFLNPVKISGICGRLLCCLSFEQTNYEEFHRRCPKLGKRFSTGLGQVKVLRANLFSETITVALETGEEREVALAEWEDLLAAEPPSPNETPAAAPSSARGGHSHGRPAQAERRKPVQAGRPQPEAASCGCGRSSHAGHVCGCRSKAPGQAGSHAGEAAPCSLPALRSERLPSLAAPALPRMCEATGDDGEIVAIGLTDSSAEEGQAGVLTVRLNPAQGPGHASGDQGGPHEPGEPAAKTDGAASAATGGNGQDVRRKKRRDRRERRGQREGREARPAVDSGHQGPREPNRPGEQSGRSRPETRDGRGRSPDKTGSRQGGGQGGGQTEQRGEPRTESRAPGSDGGRDGERRNVRRRRRRSRRPDENRQGGPVPVQGAE